MTSQWILPSTKMKRGTFLSTLSDNFVRFLVRSVHHPDGWTERERQQKKKRKKGRNSTLWTGDFGCATGISAGEEGGVSSSS
jgi:hypothetical protein